jgi:hypothetical protein
MIGSRRNTRIEDEDRVFLVLDTLQDWILFPSRVLEIPEIHIRIPVM